MWNELICSRILLKVQQCYYCCGRLYKSIIYSLIFVCLFGEVHIYFMQTSLAEYGHLKCRKLRLCGILMREKHIVGSTYAGVYLYYICILFVWRLLLFHFGTWWNKNGSCFQCFMDIETEIVVLWGLHWHGVNTGFSSLYYTPFLF